MEVKLDIILLLGGSSFQPLPLTPTSRGETTSPAIVTRTKRADLFIVCYRSASTSTDL